MIHPTAIIDPDSRIPSSVEIGPYTIIGKDVTIGENTVIGSHSYIEFTTLGKDCRIGHNIVIGTAPQDFKYRDKKTRVTIGDNCVIREFATVHRASLLDVTKIGSDCYLMAYSHVAHDSELEEGVVMANCASLGGHIKIEKYAVIGGSVAVHQFVRIGELAMLGGGAIVTQDVPPYMLACGDRARLYGLNTVGLKRRKLLPETIKNLKTAYRILFLSKRPFSEAFKELEIINKDNGFDPKVQHLIDFIKKTNRGICHP